MKRKIFSVLLALVLVLSFSLVTTATPVQANGSVYLVSSGGTGGVATWSTTQVKFDTYSAALAGGTDGGASYGQVWAPVNIPLANITDVSFWYYLSSTSQADYSAWPVYKQEGQTYTDSTGYVTPYVTLEISDGTNTHWVVSQPFARDPDSSWTAGWEQWSMSDNATEYPAASGMDPTEALWHDESFADNVTTGGSGAYPAGWEYLSFFKTTYGGYNVVKLKISMGWWAFTTDQTAYVDDITINTTTYNVDLPAARPLTVDDDRAELATAYFQTIQGAIDVAVAGETIQVYAGTYTEQVYISKANLTVESTAGAATTIIDGTGVTDANLIPGHGGLVWLQKDGITFEGFTVQDYPVGWGNGGVVFLQGWNGTTVDDISGCTVTENTITVVNAGDNGIVVSGGADSNTISNNTITVSGSGGDGIIVSGTAGNDTTGNQITGNTITSLKYGVSLCTDSWGTQRNFPGTVISGNTISGGTNGIGILYATGNATSHIVIQNNTISGVTTGDGEGIELYHGGYVDILYNTLGGNLKGVQVKEAGSTNVVVNYNDLSGNTNYGLETANLPGTLDAEYNWWGATTGPQDDGDKNPYYVEAATAVADNCTTTNVDFIPWMIHTSLVSGWNIYSTPIASGTSTDTISEALDFWGTDSTKATAVYYFDSSASPQIFRAATSLDPLVPVYLNMSSSANISVLMSTSNTPPPAMTMYQGWNLVGPAQMYPMTEVSTMISAYQATGQANLVGYTQIISPSIGNQAAAWTYIRDVGTAKNMLPTEGYWVYMANQGTLGGFTYTPITPLP